MRVRSLSPDDLEEILHHNNAAVPAVNELTPADLDWFAAQAHSFLVVDAPDGSVGGFLIGLSGPGLPYESLNYRWFDQRYDAFIYVDRIVVAASGRGAGIGTRLYDAFAERGRADEVPYMLAEVNISPRNDVSLHFHDAHGFVSVGEQDTEGGSKRVTMLEKKLTVRGGRTDRP